MTEKLPTFSKQNKTNVEKEVTHIPKKIETILSHNQIPPVEKHDTYPERFLIPKEKNLWTHPFSDYLPENFTAQKVLDMPVWADPTDPSQVDFTDRKSFCGNLTFDADGKPLNPTGRTGISGRGILGKWGPNHAGDPVVTRKNLKTGAIEALLILREDCKQWAIPGGMHDLGESIFETIHRELKEEVGLDLDFSQAKIIYQGYVDDPRNTDNAWMETTVVHYHLNEKETASIQPVAADDAIDYKWINLSKENFSNLYASHANLLNNIAN